MTKKDAKDLLERQKKKLRENLKKYQEAEDQDKDQGSSSDILGPRDDIEYQKSINDVKESNNERQQ